MARMDQKEVVMTTLRIKSKNPKRFRPRLMFLSDFRYHRGHKCWDFNVDPIELLRGLRNDVMTFTELHCVILSKFHVIFEGLIADGKKACRPKSLLR